MTKKLNDLKKDFSEKSEILEKAKSTLKKEFIGIDNIIDEVIENVRSWYILSNLQEKLVRHSRKYDMLCRELLFHFDKN